MVSEILDETTNFKFRKTHELISANLDGVIAVIEAGCGLSLRLKAVWVVNENFGTNNFFQISFSEYAVSPSCHF